MNASTRSALSLSFASLAVIAWAGCGGEDTETAPTPTGGEVAATPAAPAEPTLVAADAPAPAGVELVPGATAPWIGVATPTGDAWTSQRRGLGVTYEREDGVAVMLQRQNGVPADARTEYGDSFVEVNQRDASGYAVTERGDGRVGAAPATRVDGTFDNGTPMTTRDYLLYVNGGVSSIMVRGPATEQALVRALADHVAASAAR